ncbi:type II secretion system protein GspL [Psychrobacter aestuarii]|uniref:Type II secretion system protein GspL n=1 Tax=Psychrobacter aestuarii TaxID=556327 RepID=A0ABN0VXE1_9GAMM|nr:type II secretion system protein GspL [Psychrobacter aestuarii]
MLQVWLRTQHSPLLVWHVDAQEWHPVDNWQQLHDIYGTHGQKGVCLYFPSAHALHVSSVLSPAQLKQLGVSGQQYLFEELSISAPSTLVVRRSAADTDAMQHLYALTDIDIAAWEQGLALVGLHLQALLPDFLLLPAPELMDGTEVTLYQDMDTTVFRQSMAVGGALSYAPLLLEQLPTLQSIAMLPNSEGITRDDTVLTALMQLPVQLSERYVSPSPITLPERHALNFFAKTHSSALSPYLRVALMVALAALVLQMATDAAQLYRYHQATEATKAATAEQYQAWFPNERLNPKTKLQAQVQPKLRQSATTQSAHMTMLARVSPVLKQSAVTAQTLNVQPAAIQMQLIAPNRQSLDDLVATLGTQGINAQLQQVNAAEAGAVNGEVQVLIDTANNDKGGA